MHHRDRGWSGHRSVSMSDFHRNPMIISYWLPEKISRQNSFFFAIREKPSIQTMDYIWNFAFLIRRSTSHLGNLPINYHHRIGDSQNLPGCIIEIEADQDIHRSVSMSDFHRNPRIIIHRLSDRLSEKISQQFFFL